MNSKRRRHLLLLLVICGIVFGFRISSQDFWGRHGEARRAEVSREMVVSGNWAVPHLNGEPFITKPPLYYWAAALMFTLTGTFDELSARLPSMISGTLGVLITYLWGSAMFSSRIGLFAGIILATNFLYGGMARSAEVDMMLTLFTTSSLYFFSLGEHRFHAETQGMSRPFPYFVLSAICIALGTLTKNPIGLAVPLLAIVVYLLLTRQVNLFIAAKPWWLVLVFLIVVLPWFVTVYTRVPDFFGVLYQETLGRYTNPAGTPHKEPLYYYLPALGAFAPWIMFFPGVLFSSWRACRQRPLSRDHLFVAAAFAVTFLLFSSVGSKREYYLLPLYPFLAILTAKYWDEYLRARATSHDRWMWRAMSWPLAGFAGLLVILGMSLPIASRLFLPQYSGMSVIFGPAFILGGVFLFRTFSRGRVMHTFAFYTGTTVLLYVFVLLTIVPEMNRYRSRQEFFQEAARIAGGRQVVDYHYEGYAAQFYMQRIVPVVKKADELETLVRSEQQPLFIIIKSGHYEKLRQENPELAAHFEIVLAREWTSATNPHRKKRLLLVASKRI